MGFLDLFKRNKAYIDKYDEIDNNEYEDEQIEEVKEEKKQEEIKFNINLEVEEIKNEPVEEKVNLKVLSEKEIEELIIGEILNVIDNYDNFKDMEIYAKEASKNIGKEYLSLLPNFIHGKVSKPSKFRGKYDELGEWNIVVENVVLMIIFNYKEDSIEYLEKIAYGNNQIKLKAINLLCKLASEDVKTDKVLEGLMNHLVNFSDEDKIIIFGFMSQIKGNNKVIGVIQHFYKTFVKEGDVVKGYQTLIKLINAAERFTEGHLKFLKTLSMGKSIINLEEIMGIEKNDKKIIDIGKISDELKVNATITFYTLDNTDDDINSKLYYLSEYCLDKALREKVRAVIKK
ncbi:hypothetical protein JCM1393_28440 [Clostridium carnis]